MISDVDHDTLDDALRRCGASWDAAQAHGLLSSRLAVAGAGGGREWLQQVLEGTQESDALRAECAGLLNSLFQETLRQLSERLSEFAPLLPDDSDSTAVRAAALAHWCEGFLHGLVSVDHGEALKQRLAEDPLADIIRDMLQLTRAEVDEDSDEESNETAYTEIVEYVRVAVQLTYEELAAFRGRADEAPVVTDETLH
jgi:yecA family protein